MDLFDLIKRSFSTWHRIDVNQFPKWVRIKLQKKEYVKLGNREYKLKVIKILKKSHFKELDEGGFPIVRYMIIKRYYYREL